MFEGMPQVGTLIDCWIRVELDAIKEIHAIAKVDFELD
jgi:hypothetical protein